MSYSTVKAGLDDIAQAIRTERQAVVKADQRKVDAKSNLQSLPTVHADTIAEINAYVGDDPVEAFAKDELAKLTTEFQALVAEI